MTRAFLPKPLPLGQVEELIDLARRAPSAGNVSAMEWLVLDTPDDVAKYWDTTLPEPRRQSFAWPKLLNAPVIVVLWVDPSAYVARYSEDDKRHSGLGESLKAWPVPYWFVDGGAAVQTLLLGAEDAGLGALFFGLFEHEESVRDVFGVPSSMRAVGSVALGYRDVDRESSSQRRGRRCLEDVVHWGQFGAKLR